MQKTGFSMALRNCCFFIILLQKHMHFSVFNKKSVKGQGLNPKLLLTTWQLSLRMISLVSIVRKGLNCVCIPSRGFMF